MNKKKFFITTMLASILSLTSGNAFSETQGERELKDAYSKKVQVSLSEMNATLKKCSSWLSSNLPKALPLLEEYYKGSQQAILDSKSCMLNKKLVGLGPYDMHEINNQDVDLQLLLLSIEDLDSIIDSIGNLVEEVIADEFLQASNSVSKIWAYFYNDDSFIKNIQNADKAIHECFNYTKNMLDNFPETIPTPRDLKEKTGLNHYWHTSFFYNEVRIVYRQLNGYRAAPVVKLEENANKYKSKVKELIAKISTWQEKNVTPKSLGLENFGPILIGYLNKLDESVSIALKKYDRRLDPAENVGKIFTGKVDLPYGHIKTFTDPVGATIYQKGYLSALGECQSSYENSWKDIRNKYREDHNRDTPMGRALSQYEYLK